MTTENTSAEPAHATLDTEAPARPSVGLTRAQWRRLAAEAELAAKVADISGGAQFGTVASVASVVDAEPDVDAQARGVDETATSPAAADEHAAADEDAVADEGAAADEIVLTVVDSDARVVTPPSAPAGTRSPSQSRRARRGPAGASFGAGAESSPSGPGGIPVPAPLPADDLVDDFEFAARLFSFTAQTPVQVAADAMAEPAAAPQLVVPPRRGRVSRAAKRMAAASVSLSAMAAVGLLAVGVTGPAVATFANGDTRSDISVLSAAKERVKPEGIQAYVSSSQPDVTLERSENFDVTSMADIAAGSGVTNFAGTWVNDPNADIQWPFPVGVPISAAFGSTSYLSQFSRPHRGVDLTPGAGAEIHAVAAGTVRIATEAGGDYGVTVVIDHLIDGEVVSTRYGHMQYGSLRVEQGDTVEAGQIVGQVGSTGRSTGAHLHLEVLLGGTTQTDPMVWLQEHTAR